MEQSLLSAHLAAAPLLSTLSADARASAIQRFVARPFTKGQSLLRAGDQGREFGLLLTGSAFVRLRRNSASTRASSSGSSNGLAR